MNMAISWTFYSKKGVPEQPSGLRSPHGPFEAPRQQVWVVSKTDRANERWGNNSIYLPYDKSCPLNAAVALQQLELDWPVTGLQRAHAPCFPMNAASQTWSSKTLYWLLRSALLKIMPKGKVANYSFHSFRAYLATALKKAGVGTEDIMQHLRWASPNSVPIYARDDPQAYGKKVSLALQQNFAAFKSTTQLRRPSDLFSPPSLPL
jgi:hypothetical protein